MKFMNVIKKFGNKNDMIDYRNKMLDEAENLLNDGKTAEYEEKMKDIEQFDSEYATYAEQQANLAALRACPVGSPLSNGSVSAIATGILSDDSNMEYRKAFMNFVLAGTPIPQNLRNAAAYTVTSDVSAVIPNTILDRIVELIETTGTILNKVTRTYYKGGVTVPTSAVKPTATWTQERGKVDAQKKTVGNISFTYHKLKCVVAVSLTVDTVTLEVFERTVANNIAEAMVKALEKAIINGEGESSNQPKGILKETAPDGQNVTIAKDKAVTYKDLCKAEGVLPAAYEKAEWAMTKKTYYSEIIGMTDSNGQPIARVNIGMDGKPSYTILGRPVNFVAEDAMSTYADIVTTDTVFAFMFDFSDYVLNTNMDITVKHYEDNDTDDKMTKAIMLADGKVVAVHSLVTMTKAKTTS